MKLRWLVKRHEVWPDYWLSKHPQIVSDEPVLQYLDNPPGAERDDIGKWIDVATVVETV